MLPDLHGWSFRQAQGSADELLVRDVRWISGSRHPRFYDEQVAAALREVFAAGGPLLAGAEQVGDPIAVLPRLFHLLWSHELTVDLSVPLNSGSMVSLPEVA